MAKKLQFYRGPKGSIPTLSPGEPGWVTDENRLYVGTGSENVGIPNMGDLNQVGSFYVEISGSEGTYTSDHGAQEIYTAYQADKAVFAKIGENVIPLTHASLSGSTYSAQFNVLSGIEGYQSILITQSGETKHVYVTDNQPSADEVAYDNDTSGLTATDVQGAVDEVAGKFTDYVPTSQKGTNGGVATLDEAGKLSPSQKPIYTATEVGARPSTWTPSAEDVGAIAATEKGANNGVAELDGNGKVPASQLPSYVDDVVDAYVVGNTPYAQDWLSAESGGTALTPEGSKIYLVVSEGEYQNREYRWSGTQYAQISEGLALGETQDTAFRGDHGKTAYEHSQMTSGNPHNVTATDVGLGNVNNTSDADKPVSTAQQTALDLKQSKLTGTQGQYVGFNSNGEAEAVESPVLVVHGTITDYENMSGTADKTANEIIAAGEKWPVILIVPFGSQTAVFTYVAKHPAGETSVALFNCSYIGRFDTGINATATNAQVTNCTVSGTGTMHVNLSFEIQEKLVGQQGQYVGFDSSGNAVAVDPPSSLPSGGSEGKLLGYGTEPEWVDNIAETCFQLDSTRMKSCKELGITDLNDVVEAGVYTGMSAPPEFPEIANVPGYYGTSGSPFKMTVEVTEGKGEFSGITVIHQTVMSASSPFFAPRQGWPSTYIRVIQIISGSPYVGEWGAVPDIKVLTQKTVPATSWSADSTYSSIGFNYRAAVNIGDIMPEDIPDVNFSPADQYSGNLASFADTYNGGVYIYAKTQPTETVTIESAIFTRS